MVSEYKKGIFSDIMFLPQNFIRKKDSFMYNIISQNLKNVLKNKIKTLITPILYNSVDFIVDNLFADNAQNKYFSLLSNIQSSTRVLIRDIIIATFKELDEDFKNSTYRKSNYYINKSNVSRTLITIIGEISFSRTYYKSKNSNYKFFHLDKSFDLPKYDHYDPIVKAIAVNYAVHTSQALSSRITSTFIGDLTCFMDDSYINNIPRQSVFNWLKHWNTPDITPTSVDTPDTLYVMADEKYIGAQDIQNDIMIKSFVTFEDIKDVSKNRRQLVNRTVFSHYGDKPWDSFMDFIAKKYDFDKINTICLLGDGASWIKSGTGELRLSKNNFVKFYFCEFHFKQAVHHITTDADERFYLLHIFKTKSKSYFIDAVNNIIYNNPKRKDIITKKLNYIINNYTSIKSMLDLIIGSSMESHISHLISSFFSARPKGFSTKRIKQYLKLNDYKNNGINIFKLYLTSYNNAEIIKIDENATYNNYTFDNFKNGNIPILNDGHNIPTYEALYELAH